MAWASRAGKSCHCPTDPSDSCSSTIGQAAPLVQLGLPFHLSGQPPVPPRAAGPAGADNAAILAELGFDEAELAAAGAFSTEREA